MKPSTEKVDFLLMQLHGVLVAYMICKVRSAYIFLPLGGLLLVITDDVWFCEINPGERGCVLISFYVRVKDAFHELCLKCSFEHWENKQIQFFSHFTCTC